MLALCRLPSGVEVPHPRPCREKPLRAMLGCSLLAVALPGVRQCRTASRASRAHAVQRPNLVTVIRSQARTGDRLRVLPSATMGADDHSGGAQAPCIFVHAGAQDRSWLGFGGSFSEAAAETLKRLSRRSRDEVLSAYFHPSGLRYNLGRRVPIGSCDFSLYNWTCGDLPEGDMDLKGFSLKRYEEAILPMLRGAARARKAPLTLLASPWSPPPWMKTRPTFNGEGHLRPECREAWARHFVRFVEEMEKAGVPIWGVSVQNEPEAAQCWESCIYSAEEELIFVRDHLGPALRRHHEDVKILVWDHNRDGMLERASVIYDDSIAADLVWGVAYHWYGDPRFETWPPRTEVPFADRQQGGTVPELRGCAGFENVRQLADLRPDKHILFTEGCQELGGRPLSSVMGDWKLGERYSMNIIADVNAGCEGWIDWNLCLDEEGGPNHVGNTCVAPVICDTRTDKVLYQPSFWHLGHFSRYIRPGARRVLCSTTRDALEVTAFANPDGGLVVVVLNQSEESIGFWLKVRHSGETRAVVLESPRRSIQTLLVEDGKKEGWFSKLARTLPSTIQLGLSNAWYAVAPKQPYQRLP
ncbi:unnamed protein product [Effrenium voratum]|uniref:Glucosylceramidase n=1 Tax=Effrenium voratum TaxID=2562239 RepID=A0AA36N924_9DINO|nr:unnamed protein product [Effrenium voratum]